MKIGDIFWGLGIDDKGFQVDVVRSAKTAGTKGGQTLGQSLTSAFKRSWSKDELGKGLVQGFGLAGALGIANLTQKAISGVVDVIGDSIDAARDLNETMSKSEVVFGDAADEMSDWGDTAADSMGISKNAAIAAAAGFGDLFNKMDETRGASAEMSQELVQLASDIASFQNLDPGEVLEKLRAGLAGEAEPLRRVGVFLNEAKVQAKALALGFTPLNGKLSDGAKIAARYALIMEETASAQGDFARTSDGLANKQRILEAKMADASATLGQKLLPAALALTEAGIGLVDMLDDLAPAFDLAAQAADLFATATGVKASDGLRELQKAHDDALANAVPIWDLLLGKPSLLGDEIFVLADESYTALERTRDNFEWGARGVEESSDDMEGSVDEFRLAVDRAASANETALEAIIGAWRSAESELESAATDAGDAIYDPIDARADLSRIKREQAAAQAGAREAREAGKSTAEQTQKWRDLERERLKTIARLAAAGALSEKELNGELRTLMGRLNGATEHEKAAIRQLIILLQRAAAAARQTAIRVNAIGPDVFLGRAGGGPIPAGTPTIVGERGQELIVPAEDKHVYDALQTGNLMKAAMALAGVTAALGATATTSARAPSAPSVAPSVRSLGGTVAAPEPAISNVVNVAGLLPVRKPRDIVDEMQRISTLRELPARRRAPLYPVEN